MPVIVWIHGGGYIGLSTTGAGGDNLINESDGGIVVVNMEYRLGVFGFLPGSQVKEKGALNAGLCEQGTSVMRSFLILNPVDQQAALQWTQDFVCSLRCFPASLSSLPRSTFLAETQAA